MGIVGLTNQPPRYPRIGALRKGGEKPARGGWGKDLDYFRFTSDFPEVAAKFEQVYGKQPRSIRIFLPYETTDQNFPSFQKEYSAGGLVHACDGQYVIRHRVGASIVDVEGQGIPCPYQSERNPNGKIKPTKKVPGCKAQARLNVIIPDLQFGNVEVHTSSLLDIIRIDAQLRALESVRNRFGETLQGVPLILSRVEEEISTPNGDKRARRKKWMVHLTVQEEWGELLLAAMNQREMNAPQLMGAFVPALASGESLDLETGEIVEEENPLDYQERANDEEWFADQASMEDDAPAGDVGLIIADLQEKATKSDKPASEKQVKLMMQTLGELCDSEKMKRSVMMFIFNMKSGKDATGGQASVIIEWGGLPSNNWKAMPESISQAHAIYKAALIHEGQLELFNTTITKDVKSLQADI